MAQKDLIPLNMRTKEEARKIQSKGGKTVTPKQIYAQKLRWLKKKGYATDADRKWFLERITDPETDLIALQEWVDKLRNVLPVEEHTKLIGPAISLHKAKFGEKHKNLNINVDMSKEEYAVMVGEVDSFIRDVIGDEE